jgi:hypothetical protein
MAQFQMIGGAIYMNSCPLLNIGTTSTGESKPVDKENYKREIETNNQSDSFETNTDSSKLLHSMLSTLPRIVMPLWTGWQITALKYEIINM